MTYEAGCNTICMDLSSCTINRIYDHAQLKKTKRLSEQVMPFIARDNDLAGVKADGISRQISIFQECHNLKIDGKIGPETLNCLLELIKSSYPLYSGEDPTGFR